MGLINADGSFTASQYERMHKLGLGQMEFLDLLLSEMNEKFANNIAIIYWRHFISPDSTPGWEY